MNKLPISLFCSFIIASTVLLAHEPDMSIPDNGGILGIAYPSDQSEETVQLWVTKKSSYLINVSAEGNVTIMEEISPLKSHVEIDAHFNKYKRPGGRPIVKLWFYSPTDSEETNFKLSRFGMTPSINIYNNAFFWSGRLK
jgi:hypothetical protein